MAAERSRPDLLRRAIRLEWLGGGIDADRADHTQRSPSQKCNKNVA
jgi:hypothetical protein